MVGECSQEIHSKEVRKDWGKEDPVIGQPWGGVWVHYNPVGLVDLICVFSLIMFLFQRKGF